MTFLIFASACFAAYVWATYWVPETANVSLEDIDTLFQSTAGKEDLRIRYEVRVPRSSRVPSIYDLRH